MISSFLFSILLFSMPAEPTAEDEVLSEFRTIEKGKTEQVDFPKNEILNPIMIACTDKVLLSLISSSLLTSLCMII